MEPELCNSDDKENEGRYRAIFRASRDALLVAEAGSGMLLDANPAAMTLLGRSLEEIRTLHQSEVHAPEDDGAGRVAFEQRRLAGGSTDHVVRRADGTRIPVLVSASPMRGPRGEELVLGVFHELTERNRANEALRHSEARLRAITDSAQDAIVMMNPCGQITYWNPAAESILGFSSEEALGNDLHQLLTPERYRAAFHQNLPKFLRTGMGNAVGKTVELAAQRKDGQEIAIDLSLSSTNLDGEWHAVGIIRDITLRKRAAQALLSSEEKFRQLAENIHQVFWLVPADGSAVLYVSPAYEQVWERSCASLYQNPASWGETIHPDDRKRALGLLAAKEPFEMEYRIQVPSGREKWIRTFAVPIFGKNGELVRIAGIAEDITERKHRDWELIQAREQAQASNRAKSAFLATMSHELRTPLNAILGFTELVETDMGERGVHIWDNDLREIQRAGDHLLAVINDVLDYSQMEADQIELAPESMGIMDLVQGATAGIEPVVAKNRIDFQIECEPATLHVDRAHFVRCLANLLGNACKFTHGGRVRVYGRCERYLDRRWYTMQIVDTGIGIRTEDLPKLFSHFTQLDSSRTRKYGGTGLGLAISRRIANVMGGDITVESTVGQGSTFTLRIPMNRGM